MKPMPYPRVLQYIEMHNAQLLTILFFLSILSYTDGRHKQLQRPTPLRNNQNTSKTRRKNDKRKSLKIVNADIPWTIMEPAMTQPEEVDKKPNFVAVIATNNEEPVCSAAIISTHFVVSSCARCLQRNGGPVPVGMIRIMINDKVSGLELSIHQVVRIVLHPNCLLGQNYDLKHDLGIAQTAHEMIFTSGLSPLKIPWRVDYRSKKINWILAAFSPNNTITDELKYSLWYTEVPILGPPTCRLTLNSTFYDPTYNYCTPYHHLGRIDDCRNDFGASLVVSGLLVGILIHKFACGGPDSSASFTNVAYNGQWISETMQTLSGGMETAQECRKNVA